MLLGNEQILLEYLKSKNEIVYASNLELSKELNVSLSSINSYKKKLKELGLINYKSVFNGCKKTVAYEVC